MTLVRNPFDAGGYSLAEMTQAINILPNLYTRLGQIGLFRFEGVTQRSVIIEQYEGVLNLLPSVPLGGPSTVGTREGRSMRSFALPWIPHDDVILPGDIQGQPALGVFDGADPLVEVMNRKLQLMRRKHAQTREYMEMNALRGIVKDGAGTKDGFWLAIPTPAAGKSTKGGRITPGEWERRTGLRLRFIYRRRGPSLLVAEGRLNSKGRAVASRSKNGRGVATVPVFLLVPQAKLRKRLDLARDTERAADSVPMLIVQRYR